MKYLAALILEALSSNTRQKSSNADRGLTPAPLLSGPFEFMTRCPSWIIFRSEYTIEVTTDPVQGTKAHGERGVAPPIPILTTSWE